MLTDRIVGRVGADILQQRLDNARFNDGSESESAALFRLDKLSATQIAAVVREIINSPELAPRIDLRIPETLVEGEDLPTETLTSLNAGAVRNAGTTKEALLTANGNEHNLADTLGHVSALGAKELRASHMAWVEAACHVAGMSPTADDRRVFAAALKGLIAATELSLNELGEYCARVSEATTAHGHPIRHALGWAMPWIGLPRDTLLFSSSKTFGTGSTSWRRAYEKLYTNRAPLLKRLRPNGQPLDNEELRERFEQNIDVIADHAHDPVKAFIAASPGDERTWAQLASLEWELDGVHYVFDKPRARQLGLADETRHFFEHDCDEADLLDDHWQSYLDELKVRERRSAASEESDESFFDLHRRFMEDSPKLLLRWEKFIFGKPIECHDFLDGFTTAAQRLAARAGVAASGKDRFLRLTVNKGRKEWRERFNHDVGSFFSLMYRGLRETMGDKVDWRVERMGAGSLPDPLFNYPAFAAKEKEIRGSKFKRVTSLARKAVQIKFEVALIEGRGDDESVLEKTQLLWVFRPDSIGLSLYDDLCRLQQKGSVACTEVPRRMVSNKGGIQSVSLLNTATLEATFSRDAGSLVPAANKLRSLRAGIKGAINELANEGRLATEQQVELKTAWDAFEADYNQAVKDFAETGLHGEAVMRQADSFAAFLRALLVHARGDVCRAKLVSEALSIGTVRVTGERPCVIIPPWHPERMKALAVKTRRVAGLVTHILSSSDVSFGDRNIFFREFSEELAHPFYPEIAIATRGGVSSLVSETSTVNGYSLLERPVSGEGGSLSDVDPSLAAKQAKELMERYVSLQPHEAAHLSVLLYNADAAELPLSVVRELAGMQTNGDFQCNVSVRHRNPEKLRQIYAELVAKSGDDPDLPVVSETSDNFMSKLRISALPASAVPSSSSEGFRPFDIAFLHDVVSRTAVEEWIPVDWSNERPSLDHAPSRWSYRSVSGENELKSTTFLTCPRQTATGWAYVNAVASVARQQDASLDSYLLPARRISLQSEKLKEILDDAHSLAEWVATYDELLDKRQLQANGITVVRYRRATTNGRNMIVSSTSELRLLGVLIKRRLDELVALGEEQLAAVAEKAKRDALSISGDIVLRAAKRGVSAGEMIGLVMSRYLIETELKALADGRQAFTAYFLLDDYADWLAQRENRIADILGLCVEEGDDGPLLHVVVVESKYVSANSAADARRSSKAQLLATLSTFREALFGDPGRLDRDLWLSRLADLLVDADIPPGSSGLLERLRVKLRDGEAKVSLRGYSHVFIHSADPTASSSGSERILLDSTDGIEAWQEVFERSDLRQLLDAYSRNEVPTVIRASFGADFPWTSCAPRLPASRVAWSAMAERIELSRESETAIEVESPAVDEPIAPQVPSEPAGGAPDTAAEDKGHAEDITVQTPAQEGQTAFEQLVLQKVAGHTAVEDEREAWADEATRKLKTALNGYGLQASVLGTRLTPNGCLVRLAGSDRLRVEDIESKRTQLLTTHALRLIMVQPKPGEIVVTLAGDKRQSVSLWDVWARRRVNRNAAGINTSYVLGVQEIDGAILYLNLGGEFGGLAAHEPHSLVAGATGSGKSVLIQAILLDIAATNAKELAQVVLVDPKMGVDYAALEALPHMREPIITTRERAAEVLSELVEEMESRYRTFATARARDLATYNAKSPPESRLPMIFLVHDEFADWMLEDDYKAAVGAAVQRLGVKARAAGIHLIFAAQRPDKDVMPMQLRENLGNRLILKVASEATSKIALDRPGAEMLLGKGHLAAKLNGEQGLVFAQAPFLSDEDIAAVVEAIRTGDPSTS